MLELSNTPLALNVLIFAAGASVVWFAGTRIARYADTISQLTGIGHAALGLLLLGGVTSLPEAAVTVSAAGGGNTALAVNNLLGGIAMQIAILAGADFAIGRHALTAVTPDPMTLLQGALNVVMLGIVGAGIVVGDWRFLGAGLWSWGILAFYLYSIRLLAATRQRSAWQPVESQPPKGTLAGNAHRHDKEITLRAVLARTCAAGGAILIAGFVLARSAEAIAEQTDIGASFIGAVLVAISTSLPEVSTVLSAARLGLYTLAISDIFGTNLFDVALIWLVDIVSPGAAVLDTLGAFSLFAVLLAIVVTALFIAGLAERRDRTLLRMGIDSIAVLACYLGGIAVLYTLR